VNLRPARAGVRRAATGSAGECDIGPKVAETFHHAVHTVLQGICDEDCLGFSYGLRPGRSQRQASDARAISEKRVGWVLDAGAGGCDGAGKQGDGSPPRWPLIFLCLQ
jgi:hypothetical protein